MEKQYCISWIHKTKQFSGTLYFKPQQFELSRYSLEELGQKVLNSYLKEHSELGELCKDKDRLAYYLSCKTIVPSDIEMLSVFQVINDRDEIGKSGLDDKTKEKIQKLLNLSMSENENEAEVASMMAYKLMKKHSISRDELDEQPFILLDFKPRGKRISSWEINLYNAVATTAGVLFVCRKGENLRLSFPEDKPLYRFLGRKSDVLNVDYVASCYLREIDRLVKKSKKQYGYTQKEANDYRMGLIDGIYLKLKKDATLFFTEQEQSNSNSNIVPLDTRISEAKALLSLTSMSTSSRKCGSAYSVGSEEAKKINIQKATTGGKGMRRTITCV